MDRSPASAPGPPLEWGLAGLVSLYALHETAIVTALPVLVNRVNAEAMACAPRGREGRVSTALALAQSLGYAAATATGGAWIADGLAAGVPLRESLLDIWSLAAIGGGLSVALLWVTPPTVEPGVRAVALTGSGE